MGAGDENQLAAAGKVGEHALLLMSHRDLAAAVAPEYTLRQLRTKTAAAGGGGGGGESDPALLQASTEAMSHCSAAANSAAAAVSCESCLVMSQVLATTQKSWLERLSQLPGWRLVLTQ